MTTNSIIRKLNAAGIKVTKSISTGNIVATPRNGFAKIFPSYAAAYRFYFN